MALPKWERRRWPQRRWLLSTLVLKNGDETRSKKELTEEEQNELGEKQVVHIHIVFVYFAIGLLRLYK